MNSKKRFIRKRPYKPSSELIRYVDTHPFCEACGEGAHGLPHHIKTTGAHGRIDEPWNLLGLCYNCHYGIVHNLPGIEGLVRRYPRIENKVRAARGRA